jgi:hypothetical protein
MIISEVLGEQPPADPFKTIRVQRERTRDVQPKVNHLIPRKYQEKVESPDDYLSNKLEMPQNKKRFSEIQCLFNKNSKRVFENLKKG